MDHCFLSLEEDKPLGIWWADSEGCGVIDLQEFFKESLIDMSEEQARRYANEFEQFTLALRARDQA